MKHFDSFDIDCRPSFARSNGGIRGFEALLVCCLFGIGESNSSSAQTTLTATNTTNAGSGSIVSKGAAVGAGSIGVTGSGSKYLEAGAVDLDGNKGQLGGTSLVDNKGQLGGINAGAGATVTIEDSNADAVNGSLTALQAALSNAQNQIVTQSRNVDEALQSTLPASQITGTADAVPSLLSKANDWLAQYHLSVLRVAGIVALAGLVLIISRRKKHAH